MSLIEQLRKDMASRPLGLMDRLVEYNVGGLMDADLDEDNLELGGPRCMESMGTFNRFSMQIFSLSVCIYAFYIGQKDLSRPFVFDNSMQKKYYSGTRLLLLLSLVVVFGMQLMYKMMRRLLVFMLCPCHMNTLLWIYVLGSKPSKVTAYVREFGLHVFHGQVVALLFPTDHWLDLPFEKELFWIQHIFISAMPFITLIMDREYYRVDNKIIDWNWYLVSYGAWIFWHCGICHPVSVLTLANVGHMLCPARTDPFAGPFDKHAAMLHQVNLIFLTAIVARTFGRLVQRLFQGCNEVKAEDDGMKGVEGMIQEQLPQLHGKA